MKHLKLLALLLFVSINAMAQQKHKDRIKTLKIAVITQKLDLTEKEAQKFWPIYNAHDKEISAIKSNDIRAIRKDIRENIASLTDDKATLLLARLDKAEDKIHALRIQFSKDLSSVISPKKIILLRMAEDDFRRKMFEQFKKRKH